MLTNRCIRYACAALAALSLSGPAAVATAEDKKPNILIIMGDDIGWFNPSIYTPGADLGLRAEDPTIAEVLRQQGYATGQFGKNHLGDKDEFLPTNHGFDEFFGNLYHLNAEEDAENRFYPQDPAFRKRFGPRGVLKTSADGKIEDTGPLTKKRMETIDDE